MSEVLKSKCAKAVTWALFTWELLTSRHSDLIGRAEAWSLHFSQDQACLITQIPVLLWELWLFMLFRWMRMQKTWVLVLCVISRALTQLRIQVFHLWQLHCVSLLRLVTIRWGGRWQHFGKHYSLFQMSIRTWILSTLLPSGAVLAINADDIGQILGKI